MNPLHLGGYGLEILTSNAKPHAELTITDGRQNNNIPARYLFLPRRIPYDSIILENSTGHISLAALRWLSAHHIPVFFLDFDGSTISSILPPTPIKADLRVAQIQASNNNNRKLTIAKAIVQGKIRNSLFVLEWLSGRYDIEKELEATRREAPSLNKVGSVPQVRTVEGRVAQRYWEAFGKVVPKKFRFESRSSNSHNNNTSDAFNASLNYGYGYLKILSRTAINSVGLEPAVGFLHETQGAQTSEALVYDLEEPYRFLIDIAVVQTFEAGELSSRDFTFLPNDYQYRILWDGKMRLLEHLRAVFNSRILYKARMCTWDFIIEQKALELARYLTGKSQSLDFCEPNPEFERTNGKAVRETILSMTNAEARELDIGKQTMFDLRKKAKSRKPFKLYSRLREKLTKQQQ
jgi:CRISPR-associated protein Cas1